METDVGGGKPWKRRSRSAAQRKANAERTRSAYQAMTKRERRVRNAKLVARNLVNHPENPKPFKQWFYDDAILLDPEFDEM